MSRASARQVGGLLTAMTLTVGALSAAPAYADGSVPETTGGPTHTWTNPQNAGGYEGQTIPGQTTVSIACKLQGFQVADGNTWWYKIGSSPWNGQYYASADAFYNNGQTSGSLHGTPYVDPNVPDCGSDSPPPPPPAPAPSVQLAQGPAAPAGYRYAITLHGFAASSGVRVTCFDSVSPGGFYSFTLTTNGNGDASTASSCYSGDGPDHWVRANDAESNHVSWGGTSGGGTTGGTTGSTGGSSTGGGATGGSSTGGSSNGSTTGSGSTSGSASGSTGSYVPPTPHGDPCMALFGGGGSETHGVFGGTETNYDRQSSLYQVCEGYGLTQQQTHGVLCAVTTLLATTVGKSYATGKALSKMSTACDGLEAGAQVSDGNWLGAAKSVGRDFACAVVGDVLATVTATIAGGAAVETGPGAAATAAWTFRSVMTATQVVCGPVRDAARSLGGYLESKHEQDVRNDVLGKGVCLRYRHVFGVSSWSVASC